MAYSEQITLQWDPPTHNSDGSQLDDLSHYRLYYGYAHTNYIFQVDSIRTNNLCVTCVTNLLDGSNYYFAATAVNSNNVESDFSDEFILYAVAKANQTITSFPNPGTQWVTNKVRLSATASSGLPVTFAVRSGPGTLANGTNLTFSAAGTVVVVASQDGNTNWNAAPSVTNTVLVTKAVAGVTLSNLSQPYSGAQRVVTATTAPMGLAVVLTYNGGASAPINAGSYAVTGTVNDVTYQGSRTGTLLVAKADQTITNFPNLGTQWVTNKVRLSATASSGLPVTFAVRSGPGTLASGTNLTFSAAGTVVVVASQDGNTNWNAAPSVTNSIPVTLAVSPQPVLAVSSTSLVASCTVGQNVSSQTCEVWNADSGILRYKITDSVSWLSESPTSGTSTGDLDKIRVNYSTAGLWTGIYAAVITVADTNAGVSGSPKTIPVTLTVTSSPDIVIVDNADGTGKVAVAGTWTLSASSSGFKGNYLHDGNTNKGTKSVTFTPNLPTNADYKVYMWWYASTNRVTNVPVDIAYSGGTTTVVVNQRLNGGKWNLLGRYSFTLGTNGWVKIRTDNTTGGVVIADAVLLEKVPPPLGILTSTNAVTVPEGGTASFQVKLNTAPVSPMTVTVSRLSGDTDIAVQSGTSLVFNASNWSTNKTVTLSAAGDLDTASSSAVIRCSVAGVTNKDVTATEKDTTPLTILTSAVKLQWDPANQQFGWLDTGRPGVLPIILRGCAPRLYCPTRPLE